MGSDDDTIIRIFISRAEVDLRVIAEKFKEFSGRELDAAIEQVNIMNTKILQNTIQLSMSRILAVTTRKY